MYATHVILNYKINCCKLDIFKKGHVQFWTKLLNKNIDDLFLFYSPLTARSILNVQDQNVFRVLNSSGKYYARVIFLTHKLRCLSYIFYCKFLHYTPSLDKGGINSVYSLSSFHGVFSMLFIILSHTKYKNKYDFTMRIASKMIMTVGVVGVWTKCIRRHTWPNKWTEVFLEQVYAVIRFRRNVCRPSNQSYSDENTKYKRGKLWFYS